MEIVRSDSTKKISLNLVDDKDVIKVKIVKKGLKFNSGNWVNVINNLPIDLLITGSVTNENSLTLNLSKNVTGLENIILTKNGENFNDGGLTEITDKKIKLYFNIVYGYSIYSIDNFQLNFSICSVGKRLVVNGIENDIVPIDNNYPKLPQLGRLYNWNAAVNVKLITAAGWHLPSLNEFQTLIDYLGGNNLAVSKLKENSYRYWVWGDVASNISKFNARGSGHITDSWNGIDNPRKIHFYELSMATYFWTTTEYLDNPDYVDYVRTIRLQNYNNIIDVFTVKGKNQGASIRLIKDNIGSAVNGEVGQYIGNDGTVYGTICIGNQIWMSENLAETKYRDNSLITEITDGNWASWENSIDAMTCYDSDTKHI